MGTFKVNTEFNSTLKGEGIGYVLRLISKKPTTNLFVKKYRWTDMGYRTELSETEPKIFKSYQSAYNACKKLVGTCNKYEVAQITF